MKRVFSVVLLGASLVLAGSAFAQEAELLCCGTLTCDEEEVVVGSGADTECCVADNDGNATDECRSLPWVGRRCQSDPAVIASSVAPPDRVLAGCAEEAGVACIGGAIPAGDGPVKGCFCVGDACEADVDFPNGKEACTRLAVQACCEVGACE